MKKKIALLLSMALMVGIFTGCGPKEEAAVNEKENVTSEGDNNLEGKHLVVALSPNYKNFESVVTDSSGKESYEGLDIDILEKLSENLGFTYEIKNMPFASLIGSLQSGQADFVISGMSPTEERKESVDFSEGYAVAKTGILTLKDSEIKTGINLEGKKIACSAGTNFEKTIAGTLKDGEFVGGIEGAELVTFDGQAAVMQELKLGRVDAAMTDGATCKKFTEEDDTLSSFILTSEEGFDIQSDNEYAIAFPKGSPYVEDFNAEIQKLKEDGTIKEIITKWLGAENAE